MSFYFRVALLSVGIMIGPGCGGGGQSERAADTELVIVGMPEIVYVGDNIRLRSYEVWPDGEPEPIVATWSVDSVEVEMAAYQQIVSFANEGFSEIAIRSLDGRIYRRAIEIHPRVIPNPLVSTNIEKFSDLFTDDNGIPLTELEGQIGYYPINISQIAQHYFASWYITDNPETLRKFLVLAEWLADSCSYIEEKVCLWLTSLDVSAYRLPNPWASAMAQGQAISSLISAYWVTRDSRFLDVARAAISGFQVEIERGGFRSKWRGWDYFEEYGSIDAPSRVLNGFLFSLAGLWEAARYLGDTQATTWFQTGVDSLRANVHLYDLGFTSLYDYSELKQVASAIGDPPDLYHELHIVQLLWLSQVTGDPFFRNWASRFLEYDMGQFSTFPALREESAAIVEVAAGYSIEPDLFGPSNLIDGNWTFGRYWSSNRFPVDLDISLDVDAAVPRSVGSFALVAISDETRAEHFQLFEAGSEDTLVFDSQVTPPRTRHLVFYRTRQHEAFVDIYELDQRLIGSKFRIRILSAKGQIVALREIAMHFPRANMLERIDDVLSARASLYLSLEKQTYVDLDD